MGRDGISTLTADQLHMILRPMASVITDTTSEAIAPPLRSLKESFEITVERAEDEANDRLDRILSEGKNPLIVRIDLSLKNRELKSESDVEALLDEIRERLLEQVRSGAHIRLV
jgi:MoxR-like ATPase